MTAESRLRTAVWAIAALVCVGTPIELLLTGHWEPGPQLIPFALSIAGLVAIGFAALRPSVATFRAARWTMGLLCAGGLFGMWEHLEHNWTFAAEIDPEAGVSSLVLEAVAGANPLLAPGIFVVIGLLGFAAARPGSVGS